MQNPHLQPLRRFSALKMSSNQQLWSNGGLSFERQWVITAWIQSFRSIEIHQIKAIIKEKQPSSSTYKCQSKIANCIMTSTSVQKTLGSKQPHLLYRNKYKLNLLSGFLEMSKQKNCQRSKIHSLLQEMVELDSWLVASWVSK